MTATARDLLAMKNSAVVYTCSPETSIDEASRIMRDWRVGSLVVVGDGAVQGLLTERDVVKRVVAEGMDAAATQVRDVMQRDVPMVWLETDLEAVEATLRARRVHYVPVVAERGLVGVISIGDLARFQAARERALAERDRDAIV
jgi:CBS domain-containing protein